MKKSITLLLVVLTVSFGQAAWAAIHEINVGDSFSPQKTTVEPGDTVRWILASGTHSVVSDASSPKAFSSGEMTTVGETFDVVFHYVDGRGPFPYHCGDHPSVVDTIFTADSCSAAFDLNGDGFPMSVADLVALIREFSDIQAGNIPIPDNIYQADLTGDCVVDSNDVQLLQDIFIYGLSIVPRWPVPTCCYPTLGAISCCVLRGDADHNGSIDMSDIIFLVDYSFSGDTTAACQAELDVNNDGTVDISDLIYMIEYMFDQGAPPPVPCYSVQ